MSPALKSRPVVRASGGTYHPAPKLIDGNSIGARIATLAAASRDPRNPFADQSRWRCYELMVFAHARGATIRQLSELTGWTSSSTIYNAIERTRRRLPADDGVLADECPAGMR